MKHRFTFFKLLTLSLLIGVCTTAFGQVTGTYFKNFSEIEGVGAWASGGGSQDTEGHYVKTAAAGTRADNHYNSLADENTDAPELQADYITLTPSTDVFWAIKFVGTAPPIGEKSQWLYGVASDLTSAGWSGKVAPAGSLVTEAGNTVYYWDFSSTLAGGGYTGATEFHIRRQSYVITLGASQTGYTIDWVGSFTTLTDVENMAEAQDDGVNDEDELAANARLSEITVNGDPLFVFDPFSFTYDFILPLGTVDLPIVGGTVDEVGSTITLNQATALPGAATIVVTAADVNATEETYTINFTVRAGKEPQFFFSFSDPTQNALLNINDDGSGPDFTDGHMTSNAVGGGRIDFEYAFAGGSNVAVNPYTDKYFAVKCVGSVPDEVNLEAPGHHMDLFFDGLPAATTKGGVEGGTTFSVGGNFPVSIISTPGGNDVAIFKMKGAGSALWDDWDALAEAGVGGGDDPSEFDLFADRLELRWNTGAVEYTMALDWIGFFATIEDIEAAALSADDDVSEVTDDTNFIEWAGSAWSSAEPTATDNAYVTGDYTGAGFACRSLYIEDGASVTISSGALATGSISGSGTLNIASGATLWTASTNIGEATINRNTNATALAYSFVGSPVASDAGITGANLGANTYSYDETEVYSAVGGARWVDASSTQLVAGVGYTQSTNNALSFTGIPNAGDITVAGLTYTAGTASQQGWNLLSNPYPAAIDASAFIAANTGLDAAIYLWDDNNSATEGSNSDYLTVTALGTADQAGPNGGGEYDGYLGSMQGFFVKVAAEGTTDVTFTETMRDAGNNADANFFRESSENPLNIKLAISSSNGLYNETLIGLRKDATLGIDRLYDASKLIGNANIAFYSLIGDSKYAIQGLPVEAGISTELAFNLSEASELKLSVVELGGLEAGMSFFLEDKVSGEVYELSDASSFDFAAAAGSDQNRFTLSYGAARVLSNSITSNQPIYRYLDDQLIVNFDKSLDVQDYAVYDLSGKILLEGSSLSSTKELSIPISNKGINIIKIVTSEGVFARKFLF